MGETKADGKRVKTFAHFPGIAGAFVRVTMHNFMCHSNCEVELGPRINYITGENGSWKSAILTALSVALGAKMRSVGRSSSKSFNGMIKSGSTQAKITVVISNDGPDAFKPESYGKAIVVEKTLNGAGANVLRLKSARGDIVGTKMEELHKLTDHFCVDVDNPITVMTQDMAKKFLHSGDYTKKYQFFVQATLLESLQQQQTMAKNNLKDARETLQEHLESIPRVRSEVEELEHELNTFERIRELREKATNITARIAWSKVYDKEMEIKETEDKVKKNQALVREATEKLAEIEQQKEASSGENEALAAEYAEFEKQLQDLQKQRHQVEMDYREAGRRLQSADTDKLTEEKSLKKLTKKISDVESKIQRTLDAQRGERTETDRRLQALNDTLIAAKQAVTQCNGDIEGYKHALDEKERAQRNFFGMKKSTENDINEIRKQVSTLKQTSTNRLVLYGQHIHRLCDALQQRQGEFSLPPIGPIGAHVTLKDQKWIAPVEESLGAGIGTFLVASSHDMDKLRKLSRECGVNNLSIALVNFNRGRYEIPAERVPNKDEFTTVASVLDFKHDAVFNFLVDSAAIERTVLMTDENAAQSMFRSGAARAKQVANVFTQNRKVFMSGKTVRNEAFRNMDRARRLGADPKAQIVELQKAITQKQATAREYSNDEVSAMKAVKEIRDMLKKKEAEYSKLEQKVLAATNQLQQAKLEAEDTNDTGVDVSTLQEELDNLNAEASKHRTALSEAETNYTRMKETYDVAKSAVDETVSLADAYKSKAQHHAKKMQTLEAKLQKVDKLIATCKKDIECGTLVVQHDEEQIKLLTVTCEEMADRFTKNFCDREIAEEAGDITMGEEALLRMLESTKTIMKKEESRHKRPYEEVSDELSEKRRKLMKLERGTETSEKIINKLRKGLKKRKAAVQEKATETAKNVSHRFNWHMQRKGHAGQINVDYSTMKLTIKVTDSAKTKAITDTRAMSGGERSYSTLAFNLALGDESDSPFRAMDEFDVFMDAVNRRISIETLLDFARNTHFDKQFLFITPQDISAVDAQADDIKIQRMRAALPA